MNVKYYFRDTIRKKKRNFYRINDQGGKKGRKKESQSCRETYRLKETRRLVSQL